MLSGIAVAAKALRPGILVLAAEPTGRWGWASAQTRRAWCLAAGIVGILSNLERVHVTMLGMLARAPGCSARG
jgi:hypothetical protein